MVSEIFICPDCGGCERVVRFGFNKSGTRRLRCQDCRRIWTPTPKSRAMSAEKEALIEKALQERVSQRAIARTFRVARTTVREVLKKSLAPAA